MANADEIWRAMRDAVGITLPDANGWFSIRRAFDPRRVQLSPQLGLGRNAEASAEPARGRPDPVIALGDWFAARALLFNNYEPGTVNSELVTYEAPAPLAQAELVIDTAARIAAQLLVLDDELLAALGVVGNTGLLESGLAAALGGMGEAVAWGVGRVDDAAHDGPKPGSDRWRDWLAQGAAWNADGSASPFTADENGPREPFCDEPERFAVQLLVVQAGLDAGSPSLPGEVETALTSAQAPTRINPSRVVGQVVGDVLLGWMAFALLRGRSGGNASASQALERLRAADGGPPAPDRGSRANLLGVWALQPLMASASPPWSVGIGTFGPHSVELPLRPALSLVSAASAPSATKLIQTLSLATLPRGDAAKVEIDPNAQCPPGSGRVKPTTRFSQWLRQVIAGAPGNALKNFVRDSAVMSDDGES